MKHALLLASLILALGAKAPSRAQSSSFLLSPDKIAFSTVTVGQSASQPVRAFRSFDDGTVVTATSSHPAFSVSPMSQVVGTDGATYTVRFQPTAGGPASGIITFSEQSNGQTRVLGELPVSGSAYAPFTVNPTSLTFDRTLVGSSMAKTFRILVDPQAPALDLAVQSSNAAVFSVSPAQFSGLQSGQAGVVTVTFRPNAAGLLRGSIRVVGGGATVSLEVDGEGGAFLLSTTQLDLGGALVGCSTARNFTLTTGGPFDFQIVPTAQGSPFSADPSAFSADASTDVAARFTPTAPGPAQGSLRVFARADGKIVQQQDLSVSGVGTQPVPDPSSIDFGSVPAGATSAPRSTVIMPNPAAPFQGVYSASSDNPAFQVLSTNTSGRVEVAFSPLTEGPANGIITVEVSAQSDRDCSVPVRIPVTGVGGEALLTLSPTSVDFGMQAVGQLSLPRDVLVTNESGATFTGTILSDNPAFRVSPPVPGAAAQTAISVPAGGSVRVPVSFQPAALGIANGTITFELQASQTGSSEPIAVVRTVSVRGEGVAANLSYLVVQGGSSTALSPGGVVNFGPTAIGSTNSVTFEIRNEGDSPAPIDGVSASDAPVFTLSEPALPADIAPGAALTLTLAFQPTAFLSYNGTLTVGSAGFQLAGSGVLDSAEITGLTDTIPGNEQPSVGVVLSSPAQQNLTGTLSMTYTPVGGLPPDPSVQFETSGTSVSFTVPEGSTNAIFPNGESAVAFQSGTVAAGFVFTVSLASGDTDVTPSPAPTRSASVLSGAPSISSVSVESVTANGFTVVVEGFSPTREITQATFSFTGRNGVQVEPASITPSGIAEVFQAWFASPDSQPYGSMFTLTMPFTISGETNGIGAVSATVSNTQGASQTVSANLP